MRAAYEAKSVPGKGGTHFGRAEMGATFTRNGFLYVPAHARTHDRRARRRAAPARRLERLHDLRVVRPPEGREERAALGRDPRQLGRRFLRVPANRIGFGEAGYSLAQLKVMQEVITMTVFAVFAAWYMKERITLDFLWAGLCLAGAAYFMFRAKSAPG
jgi:hypothetical protein